MSARDAWLRQPLYDTPVGMGAPLAVVGAGNTAMDARASRYAWVPSR